MGYGSGGCGLVGCDFVGCGLAGCCLVGAAQGAAGTRASEEPRVCQVKGTRLRARAGEQSIVFVYREETWRACAPASGAWAQRTASGRRAHVHGCMFQGCAHTCARDESSLRFGRSSTSLKSSFVSSSMRSACARPLAERPDTPSTPPATAWRRESRRRNEAISRK